MNQEVERLSQKVETFIRSGEDSNESTFNNLALEVFACQYRNIAPYQKYCRQQGSTPETVKSWSEIPAVPADAFKHFFLFAGEEKDVVSTFRSSGTTQKGSNSQSHFSQTGLGLMKASVEANARRMLFPENRRTKIFSLSPAPEAAPHMIMVQGIQDIMASFGSEDSRFCIGARGLETTALLADLKQCTKQGNPVALVGSSFGFVELFDAMEKESLRLQLPEGSRLMDAGGYKGKSREIGRDQFVGWACEKLGLAPEQVVNLLGMTEMASQIYDGVLDRHWTKQEPEPQRSKRTPFWVRTQVVDPRVLENGRHKVITETEVPGLLRHLDLANVERPMMVQSEDIGILRGSGFEVLKRAKGSEPRGCSLTAEEFAARRG